MRKGNSIKRIVIGACLFIVVSHNSALAQWPSDSDLPGMYSGDELATWLIIAGSGLVVGAVIPMPKAELEVKRSDLFNKDGSFASGRSRAMARMGKFSQPCMIAKDEQTEYGIIAVVDETSLLVETRVDSVRIRYTEVKKVIDLLSAARRSRVSRAKHGILFAGLAAASFYLATIDTHPIEGMSRALNWASFAGFAGLSAYAFIHKPGEEKEYRVWHEEHPTLLSPDW